MRAGHVDESIPHIALVLEVDRQVEEVEREWIHPGEPLLQKRQKHLLGILVRDVLDHERCALVFAHRDLVQVQPVHPILLGPALSLGHRVHLVPGQPASQGRIGVVTTRSCYVGAHTAILGLLPAHISHLLGRHTDWVSSRWNPTTNTADAAQRQLNGRAVLSLHQLRLKGHALLGLQRSQNVLMVGQTGTCTPSPEEERRLGWRGRRVALMIHTAARIFPNLIQRRLLQTGVRRVRLVTKPGHALQRHL
mmetsp:Transcript_950/g.2806  ORF Transcript_950/g.2806 Transcript_950/m.2806 type:complete len:250 (-) Transcript_950:1429-2178(-)